jgi:precorrin-2 C20-methyltransferase / precorrin-3B C17-methyltransferase
VSGRLYGVGVGPGDPELVTLKAKRTIEHAPVVAYTVKRGAPGVARRIVEPYLHERHIQVELLYPVTTENTDHPGGYEGALRDFYDQAAATLAAHLDAGRDVAVLCEGDPLFYGSYMYIHDRLAARYPTEVIPGITSFSAAAAAAGAPLVRRDEVLTVVPGTLEQGELEKRLRGSDAAVVLKLGRTFAKVRDAALAAGVADRALYVERVGSERQRIAPLEEVDAATVPYMSLALVPSNQRTGAGEGADADEHGNCGGRDGSRTEPVIRGSLVVVGLGPGAQEWLTPEAQAALAEVEELVGYSPYLDRVAVRPGQRRHASDNRVEAERARHALELAAAGARVAVVSSGDPGIFAMASAVLEQLEQAPELDVEVRVVPGLSAMQAVAARVGAPLGHDFCVISLSDRLKPWDAIERRLQAAGEADMVVAIYNPASRSRREQLIKARKALLRHRAPTTPTVVARAVGSTDESVTVTTLAQLDLDSVDMRTLLIVGSSMTRTISRNGGSPRVYTPRNYPA